MNYERLLAFAVFADHLNFTRAAKQLHISQPALHVQIRKLTEEVGRPLYRRNGRALSLTPQGKHLAAFGREVQERSRSVLEKLRGDPVSGPVVLASGQGAFLYLLGPAIQRFPKHRWPLRLVSMSAPDAIEAVRDSKAHLSVIAAENPPADLTTSALRTIGQKVVLPASHRLARRRSLKAEDLVQERFVVAPADSPHRSMLQHLFRANGFELSVAVEATGWELMLQFAKYGVGITVVNDFCPVPRGMIGIPLQGAAPITYYLIERRGLPNEATEAMRKLILETA